MPKNMISYLSYNYSHVVNVIFNNFGKTLAYRVSYIGLKRKIFVIK